MIKYQLSSPHWLNSGHDLHSTFTLAIKLYFCIINSNNIHGHPPKRNMQIICLLIQMSNEKDAFLREMCSWVTPYPPCNGIFFIHDPNSNRQLGEFRKLFKCEYFFKSHNFKYFMMIMFDSNIFAFVFSGQTIIIKKQVMEGAELPQPLGAQKSFHECPGKLFSDQSHEINCKMHKNTHGTRNAVLFSRV